MKGERHISQNVVNTRRNDKNQVIPKCRMFLMTSELSGKTTIMTVWYCKTHQFSRDRFNYLPLRNTWKWNDSTVQVPLDQLVRHRQHSSL